MEVWRSPDAVGFVYLLLIIVIYPTLTLAWPPAGVVAVPMMAGCAVVAFGRFGEAAADWVIATLAAVAALQCCCGHGCARGRGPSEKSARAADGHAPTD